MSKESDIEPEYTRKSQTCLQYSLNGKYRLIYNRNTSMLFFALLGFGLGLFVGFLQEVVVPEWDILYPVDLWSIAHFITCFSLYLLLLYLIRQETVALFFAIIITTVFEPFEQIVIFGMLGNTSIIGAIGQEMIWNTVVDLVFNVAGILLAYFIFHRKPTCIIP